MLNLIGTWRLDPGDAAAREVYGDLALDFTADGRLIYRVFERGKLHIRAITYTLEDDVLVTGRPGDSRPKRSTVSLLPDGRLRLEEDGIGSTYIRVAAEE